MKPVIAPILCPSRLPAFGKDIVIHAGRAIDEVGDSVWARNFVPIKDDNITGVQP
jgi:hypothetical protein